MDETRLTGGAENYDHYHPDDRVPTHDTLARLENIAGQKYPTGDYAVLYSDDHILCNVTCNITLPQARAGKEFEVTQIKPNIAVTILPTGTDTLIGYPSVVITQQWTSLRFKAITGGYMLI